MAASSHRHTGFGSTGTTHDVGERLTWFLFAAVSEQRPAADSNRVRMQSVCLECHNSGFIDEFYESGDAIVDTDTAWKALCKRLEPWWRPRS